jgi:hypothetical protein
MKFFCSCIFVLFLYGSLSAQGCSDPGFCTAGSLGELSSGRTPDSTAKKHSTRITQSIGLSDDHVVVISSNLDVYLQLHKLIRFQVKGPIFMARHKGIKTVSIGDIFLVYNVKAYEKKQHLFTVNAGVKLPTNQSKLTYNDSVLPMVYQSSLGTFDFIIGVNYTWKHKLGALTGAFAYQQPFMHINHNKAPETLEFRRKADVLLRVDQVFNVKNKVDLGAGLLWIYHCKNDTRLNALNVREQILGSKGSTLNITGLIHWYISNTVELGMAFGVPVLVRYARPDGLTREFVFNPYLQFNF